MTDRPENLRETLLRRYRKAHDDAKNAPENDRMISAVCKTCGACCFSPVIPITKEDFNASHGRFGIGVPRGEFAEMFLQKSEAEDGGLHIETERYGGRCMFLGKSGSYGCAVWSVRPNVCREFFCWELTCFMKWFNGEEQDMFHGGKDELEGNIAILLTKLVLESPLSVFPEDAARYTKVAAMEVAPSFYERRPDIFHPKGLIRR